MRLSDTATGYGWISIALHWTAAAGIVTLWFVGTSIPTADGGRHDDMLRLHTTIALSLYALNWGRIIWRFVKGHPGPLPKQSRLFFGIGKAVHFAILGALAVMLVTGPLMAWAGGFDLHLFDLVIPSPMAPNPMLFEAMHAVHRATATAIILAVVLHVAGALKHAAFDRDGTLDKILVPPRPAARDKGA